ncbi:Ig-like domain-containing protein [Candidatus Hecatella orcuttiae]|uniref:Ig-like domain-containing protein n=1 Tax=Candidatus Hecatella orcuttiae TaxID=1935119 RepID=UPI00286811F3|nr:Ig-like domain-containing protein [Candidatus Hecatella orcuttiae]
MNKTLEKTPSLHTLLAAGILAVVLIVAAAVLPLAFAAPTVATDKDTYEPGDSLSVSGTAAANALVSLQLFDPDGVRVAIAQAEADAAGAYSAANIYTFSAQDPTGTWTVKAYEGGAFATATFTLRGVVDTTPPSLTLNFTPLKAVYGKADTFTITLTADEPLQSAVIHVNQQGAPLVIDGKWAASVEAAASPEDPARWSGSYTIMEGYDGPAQVHAVGIDLAGNKGEATATFQVDTVAPQLTVTAPSATTEATVTVTGTVDDPDITEITLTYDAAVKTVSVSEGSWSATITLPAAGSYTVQATAVDAAGNVGSSPAVSIVYTPPPPLEAEDIIGPIRADISDVKGGISDVKGGISEVKGSISEVRGSISELRDETRALSTAVSSLTVYVMVAVVLSLVAAVAAIISVVTIARKVVLK